jgi:biotin transport system substrate-specific component
VRPWLRDVTLVVFGAALVAGLSQVVIPLGFTPVPLSLGNLAVLLVGGALGARRGVAALLLWAVAGWLGAPVLAGFGRGLGGPTFGYIVGYIVAALLIGWLAGRDGRSSVGRNVLTMVLGVVVIYLFGLPYLALVTHASLATVLLQGLAPFVLGDLLKSLVAAGLLSFKGSRQARF